MLIKIKKIFLLSNNTQKALKQSRSQNSFPKSSRRDAENAKELPSTGSGAVNEVCCLLTVDCCLPKNP